MGRLSMSDVAKLGADPSPAARIDLVRKIVAAMAPGGLSPVERALAEEIFTVMARDAERLVRAELARTLQGSPVLTRKLACTLAADIDEVALPILSSAMVFTDEDLVGIVRTGTAGKQIVIAGRPALSAAVADALIATDNAEAVATLVRNEDAALDKALLCRVLDRFGYHDAVQSGVARRAVLPIAVAERLVCVASELILAELTAREDVAPEIVSSLVLRSREQAVLGLRALASSDENATELVDHLAANRRLTPSFCLRALCVGDLPLFETAMARLAGTSVVNARYLLQDAGEAGFQTLFGKTGMSQGLLPAFRVALRVALDMMGGEGPDDRHQREEMAIERILTQFDAMGAADINFLLNRLDMTDLPGRGRQLQPA